MKFFQFVPPLFQVKKDMARHREELGDTIWAITTSLEVLKEENWTGLVEAEMKRFEKEIIHAMKARGWDGSEDLTKQRWIQSLDFPFTNIKFLQGGHFLVLYSTQ